MKYIAVIFLVFIVGVVILADTQRLPAFITVLYDFPNGDKAGHFVLFGLLNFFVTRAFLSTLLDRPQGWVTLSIGLILAFLITLEEFSQKYFSSRTFDPFDLLGSFLGLFLGGWLAYKKPPEGSG